MDGGDSPLETADLGYLVGRTVEQIRVWSSFELVLFGSDDDVRVQLGTPFTYTSAEGRSHALGPERAREELGPALALHGRRVDRAEAGAGGSLELRFDDGSLIRVRADPDYEAWQVDGPGTRLVVCTPGGELAVWD